MVSIRCKMVVKAALDKLGLHYNVVELGEVDVESEISTSQLEMLKADLLKSGLELMDDKRAMLIEKIRLVIIEMIHYTEEPLLVKNSEYISSRLHHNYTYLANIFAESTGTTIEHFMIAHKIERVKELLLYDELNLTEIAYKLNYNSVSHLSNQFKKMTGLSPSVFKKLKKKRTSTLEDL
jgi:AraC-like DNA-binding protein